MTDHHQLRMTHDMVKKAAGDCARVLDLQLGIAQQVLTAESMVELKMLLAGAVVAALIADVAKERNPIIADEVFVDAALDAITAPARDTLLDILRCWAENKAEAHG